MEAVSTRLRLRVSPGARSAGVVGRHAVKLVSGHGACDKIVRLAGLDSTDERLLFTAAEKERWA